MLILFGRILGGFMRKVSTGEVAKIYVSNTLMRAQCIRILKVVSDARDLSKKKKTVRYIQDRLYFLLVATVSIGSRLIGKHVLDV